MTDRMTASTITDAQLDQLYRERDEARQHAAAIAAQRDRLRQRMNTLADRWDLEGPPPGNRPLTELRAEISCDPFTPDGALAVQPYRDERNRPRWAFRCWGTDTCDGWLGLGHHTEASALIERDRHVAEAHDPKETVGSAEADVQRVTALYEQWVKAGPPPLGTSMARWWDARLVELHKAIGEQPARTTPDNPPTSGTSSCPGFPDRCPNRRTVEPNPPEHFGGVRCGCADPKEA